jgi:DNA mismatch repair protein MutS
MKDGLIPENSSPAGEPATPASAAPAPNLFRKPFTDVPPRTDAIWKTPLFEQYWRVRDGVPGCLLFFRMGDFYELFGEDAVVAAPILEVQLTARSKDAPVPVPMCGVPAHAVDSYAEKLLARGLKIALCEQLQDPAEAKAAGAKLVERGVIRILTPGLPVDPSRLELKEPHWFVSLAPEAGGRAFELRVLDFLGGQLFQGKVASSEELEDLFLRLQPREILVPASLARDAARLKRWPVLADGSPWHGRFSPWSGEDAGRNLEDYLLYTQRCSKERLRELLPEPRDLAAVSGRGAAGLARMPSSVLEQWAVFPNLFELLDSCGSAVGSRRLRQLLASPLTGADRIRLRQKAFALLSEPSGEDFLKAAGEVYDFERLLGRFRIGAAAPKELLRFVVSTEAVAQAFRAAPVQDATIRAWMEAEGLSPWKDVDQRLKPLRERLISALETNVDAAQAGELAALIRKGYDPNFDLLRDGFSAAEKWLADFEERLRAETQIPSLKIRSNRVFGYYIEVTKTHLSKVPASFERKQTTVGGERFTCRELRERESEILQAGVRAEARAREILESVQSDILKHERDFRLWIEHFSWLDAFTGCVRSVRKQGRFGPWRAPAILDGRFRFRISEARHPVIEALSGAFVPNSVELGFDAEGGQKRLLLLTGPNMAGKSTLMRQTGLCLLLAQCGLPVPASAMECAPASGFYSRMGASDRILAGESTFMVEMKETAALLREADADSFVLVDEIGRGTSTQDGLAIARAVLEHVHDKLRSLTIFATHYHELSAVAAGLPAAVNGSMGIREWEGELVFLRTLVFEPAESSYGIYVARMAGLPESVVEQAGRLFADAVTAETAESAAVRRKKLSKASAGQVGLFDFAPPKADPSPAPELKPEEIEALVRLRALDPNELSPKAAWLVLEELASRLSR